MLVTLYLITCNLYASVPAPPNRGFSFIEIWVCGVQVPILMAIIEYGIVLTILKFGTKKSKSSLNSKSININGNWVRPFEKLDEKKQQAPSLDDIEVKKALMKMVDSKCSLFSAMCFIVFNIVYWIAGFTHFNF